MAKTIPGNEQVFMVSKSTNTTYSGSASLKAMSEWYTMDDVSNTVQPYKVFTALLTQNGGDDPDGIGTGLLTIGKTYTIFNFPGTSGYDFTNVGAPNNNVGTSFIATGTTPNSWGPDEGISANILTFNNGAPVAAVLENTIGNIWFTYVQPGFYRINSNELFPLNKIFVQGTSKTEDDGTGFRVFTLVPVNIDIINIYSTSPLLESGFDDYLINTPIEIRVYN